MLRSDLENYAERFRAENGSNGPAGAIDLLDSMMEYFRTNPPSASELQVELERTLKDGENSVSQLVLQVAWLNLDRGYSAALSTIVQREDLQSLHEPAIELLGEIGDVDSVPALASAIEYRWSYDEWLNVPRKAIQALARIGSADALAAIRRAMSSGEELIRSEAQSSLDQNGDGSETGT